MKTDIKQNCTASDDIRVCKYCHQKTLWDEMIWLNGKCMCPSCYAAERAREDAKDRRIKDE